tara:strand:- start:68 stop:949 length:882 start_codon:yes stop_codon:yes gene_type:complete
MNSKNKNIVLFVSIFIVLVIFIDIIFNFSGIMIENFANHAADNYNAALESNSADQQNQQNQQSEQDLGEVKSLVSKISGRVFNISINPRDNRIITIASPSDPKKANISVNQDGTLSNEGKARELQNQQFVLERVTNAQQYRTLIGTNSNAGADVSSSCTRYPFYVVKSNAIGKTNPPWCLGYETGNLFVHPIGNYDNQKWEVSNVVVDTMSYCTNNMNDTSTGQLRNVPDSKHDQFYNNDKIKVNFNFNDELKSKLFGIEPSSSNSESSGKCPTYLPKNSIKSLCKGCDIDKI